MRGNMKRQILLWSLALAITVASAVFQRRTGPTYPLNGMVDLAGQRIVYSLDRSHGGKTDDTVAIAVPHIQAQGIVHYRRYRTAEPFVDIPMSYDGDLLTANLPRQPLAGQLEYCVELQAGGKRIIIPEQRTAVIRFKGHVPPVVLASHILLIFAAMLLSSRTGLEALDPKGSSRRLTIWTTVLLLIGGLLLGALVQKYAFGSYWTGVPFGWHLTDNKTLIAFIGWGAAWLQHRRQAYPRYWVLAAALIMLVVFLIPHSILGSQLDYSPGQIQVG